MRRGLPSFPVRRTLSALAIVLTLILAPIATPAGSPAHANTSGASEVLVLGDSLCVGARAYASMDATLRSAGWSPATRCVGGMRMHWGLEQVLAMPSVPPTVVIALGTNGGAVEPGFELVAHTLRWELRARGAQEVHWVNLAARGDGYASKNALIERVAGAHGDAVVDVSTPFNGNHRWFHPDGIHHTAEGSGVWVREILRSLGDGNGVVGVAHTASGHWTVNAGGVVTAHDGAAHLGDMAGTRLNRPIVGIAATPDGNGYWLVASDGGIFSFGNANFHGSTGHIRLNQPIVGMATTPNGNGYWLVASDGGIFSFGNANFQGAAVGATNGRAVAGIVPRNSGYWVVDRAGAVHRFA